MRHALRLLPALALAALVPLVLTSSACRKPEPPKPAVVATPTPIRNTQKSVVKIFSTQQQVDFVEPWKPGSTDPLEGCGTILPGGRILTAANLVDKCNYVEVQKFGETKRYPAKRGPIACDLDLAILTVDDPEFGQGLEPVEFGEVPVPGDKVILQGGDELTRKENTVQGLDILWSWEAAGGVPALLTKDDIDKLIYGCPVFKDGLFVGTPLFSWRHEDNGGTLIPVSTVKLFLKGIEGGKDFPGWSDLGVTTQNLKSPDLRDYYHLPADKSGLVITRVTYGGAAEGLLKEGDVLSSINGHVINNEGYTQLEKLGRVSIDYIISQSLPGESLSVEIVRDGAPQTLSVPLKTEPKLVPYQPANRHPTYYMIGGFVFVPLTYNYLMVNWDGMKPELKDLFSRGAPSKDRRQVVLLSHVLPADMNQGYHYFNNIVVDKVNGKPIGDMKDLVAAFEHPQGKSHRIDFDDHAWNGSVIVFDAKKAKKATQELMKSLHIPADRSDDLK